MNIHFVKNYNGDETIFPQREHPKNAVKFKEAENMKNFSKIINLYSIVIFIMLTIIIFLRTRSLNLSVIGILLSLICAFPHELLHAVLFKSDVYLYSDLKLGLLFIIGTEDMSKLRFIFMSLLPNLVFGFIPFIIFLINPDCTILGTLGAASISMGGRRLL